MVDRKWWLGCVLHFSPDDNQGNLTLLHLPGPSSSFRYQVSEHVVKVVTKDVLTAVDPHSRTRRVYTLSVKETKLATQKLSTI